MTKEIMGKCGFVAFPIDFFSLYVLSSRFVFPRDITLGNSSFQMSFYERAYGCISYEKTQKKKIPLGTSLGLKWEHKAYKLK